MRGRAALKRQSQQVHPKQPLLGAELRAHHRVDRLVTAHHTLVIGPHLATPHPRRLGQHDTQGAFRLWDLNVGAPHRTHVTVVHGRHVQHLCEGRPVSGVRPALGAWWGRGD
eukprot:scaffold464_cov39-Tisochrysis_lutea.AAC.2